MENFEVKKRIDDGFDWNQVRAAYPNGMPLIREEIGQAILGIDTPDLNTDQVLGLGRLHDEVRHRRDVVVVAPPELLPAFGCALENTVARFKAPMDHLQNTHAIDAARYAIPEICGSSNKQVVDFVIGTSQMIIFNMQQEVSRQS